MPLFIAPFLGREYFPAEAFADDVLTDIASGWTECVAMPVKSQVLIVEGHDQSRR